MARFRAFLGNGYDDTKMFEPEGVPSFWREPEAPSGGGKKYSASGLGFYYCLSQSVLPNLPGFYHEKTQKVFARFARDLCRFSAPKRNFIFFFARSARENLCSFRIF